MVASFAPTVTREPLREPEIATLSAQLFSVAALFLGDDMLLSRSEADELAAPLGRMLSQHTPIQKIIRKMTDPIVLIAVGGKIAKTRAQRIAARATSRAIAIVAPQQQRAQPTQTQTMQRPQESTPQPAAPSGLDPGQSAAILNDVFSEMSKIP